MSTSGKPNVLLIIADDLGADNVLVTDRSPERKMYVMTDSGGPMILGELDILSILLRCGLEFDQAWAHASCSPTRGSIYTGTWPWRNGVGSPANPQLDPALVTALPELLGPEGYECGLFGKWHLGTAAGYRPPDHGWDRHVGTLGGMITDYRNWPKQDSDTGYAAGPNSMVYATRETVEEAGIWIAGRPVDIPWFATIAFHTPHDPFHDPPFGYELPGGVAPATDDDRFNAMAQNMDANIGRLFGTGAGPAMDCIARDQLENTVIIFLGDNGSHWDIATEEAKTTIYEGGVRVPMIVADGHAVANEMSGAKPVPRFLAAGKLNRTSPRLVHAVDLYATITEIAGVTAALPANMDSVSLWRFPSLAGPQSSTRRFNFSQHYTGDVQRATIRNLDYKLNYEHPNQWSLYAYREREVPGLENGSAEDIYSSALADVQAGVSNDAADNLNALLNELICSGNYAIDSAGTAWLDPR
ncbi:MAG: sulfatase-like hydrolase/transferase [Egibacteraceae bacterium]